MSIHRTSFWLDTAQPERRAPLDRHTRADVCVIGAGIAGLTTAYLLVNDGRSVVVIDDRMPGAGETGMTSAHLSDAIDDRYTEIVRLHGEDGARLAADSHRAAIARIEGIAARERIECDFSRLSGYLFLSPGGDELSLRKEMEAAHKAGVDVQWLTRAPVKGFDSGPCLHFPRQGQFHPMKYLNGLAAAFERAGGRLHGRTRATSVTGGSPARVDTVDGPTITCDAVVVATNVPFNDLVAIHTKQAPYHTYVIGARMPPDSVTAALYWDTQDPYHYVRVHRTSRAELGDGGAEPVDLLIVGGEDHKAGQASDGDERFERLEAWMRERFPAGGQIEFRWSGQVMESQDGLAFIGRNPLDKDNIYIATGDSGMGLTHGTIAGILLTDLIGGRDNPWEALYAPSRIRAGAAGDFLKENLNVAAQFASYVTPGDVESADAIGRQAGAVIREGLTKVAVYRDEAGELHRRSAICPHLGCIVGWNGAASTWDCPCHGSRFDPYGKVVTGPASVDLKET